MRDIVRFSARQRAEHLSVMVLFTVLVITGMPQKYYDAAFSAMLVHALGGINATRLIHRIAGVLFALTIVAHLGVAIWQVATRRLTRLSIVPGRQDYRDALATLRWYLGLSKEKPLFDRYDYRQKFEYWGLIFGALIMALSGFILYFPIFVSRVLPAELIPAAKVMHSYEALLAFLIVLIWHMAGAHLTPESFPMDTSIFTGKIRKEKLRREHALEYEDRFGGQ